MLETNKQICFSGDELIEALQEIEFILRSLHKMGSYYMDRDVGEYEKETTKFIDECQVTHRLASARYILSSKFDTTLGEDDMDDLERAMEGLSCWSKPVE